MNRFIGLIIMVVAVAALAGAAIGWRFPFLGQNRSLNQVGTAQEGTEGQTTARKQALSARQASQRARNASATRNLQAQNPNVETNTTTNTQSGQSEANDPVPALW